MNFLAARRAARQFFDGRVIRPTITKTEVISVVVRNLLGWESMLANTRLSPAPAQLTQPQPAAQFEWNSQEVEALFRACLLRAISLPVPARRTLAVEQPAADGRACPARMRHDKHVNPYGVAQIPRQWFDRSAERAPRSDAGARAPASGGAPPVDSVGEPAGGGTPEGTRPTGSQEIDAPGDSLELTISEKPLQRLDRAAPCAAVLAAGAVTDQATAAQGAARTGGGVKMDAAAIGRAAGVGRTQAGKLPAAPCESNDPLLNRDSEPPPDRRPQRVGGLLLTIEDESRRLVRMHVAESLGQLHVNVRSPDEALNRTLGERVQELIAALGRGGFLVHGQRRDDQQICQAAPGEGSPHHEPSRGGTAGGPDERNPESRRPKRSWVDAAAASSHSSGHPIA